MRPIVFLHIPKTAGQTVHNEMARIVGEKAVSPIRVHTQAQGDALQMPPGYRLYSGHIDWVELDNLDNPFTFTVLRDPRERIASFYFYLLKEAQALSEAELQLPQFTGKRLVRTQSADDYFFGGNAGWQRFIDDHYAHFYCTYFATRKMRGYAQMQNMDLQEKVAAAQSGAQAISKIYSTRDLTPLEQDLQAELGARVNLVGNYHNAGNIERSAKRWPKLMDRLEKDAHRQRLEDYAAPDLALLEALGIEV